MAHRGGVQKKNQNLATSLAKTVSYGGVYAYLPIHPVLFMFADVTGNPILPSGQQLMWNAASIQQQPVNAVVSSPLISPVAPPTVNMADLVAMPTNVNIQNLAQIQQRPILPQVAVFKLVTERLDMLVGEHVISLFMLLFYTWGDSDVILSTIVTAAMLQVCYAAAV